MSSRMKRLLAMTSALAVATAAYVVWDLLDDHVRITLVNRTEETLGSVTVSLGGPMTVPMRLAPGESRTLRLEPHFDPGPRLSFGASSVGVHVDRGGLMYGIGFGAKRWATIEFDERPPAPNGNDRAIRASFGRPCGWNEAWWLLRSRQNPFVATYEGTYPSKR